MAKVYSTAPSSAFVCFISPLCGGFVGVVRSGADEYRTRPLASAALALLEALRIGAQLRHQVLGGALCAAPRVRRARRLRPGRSIRNCGASSTPRMARWSRRSSTAWCCCSWRSVGGRTRARTPRTCCERSRRRRRRCVGAYHNGAEAGMKVYHVTHTKNARAIRARGFRDTTGTYMTARMHTGVWVADRPLILMATIEFEEIACFEDRKSVV